MTAAALASRGIGLVKCQTFLELDERADVARRIFGYQGHQLLLLAEATLAHGGERGDDVVSRFVANLRRCRPRLVKATCDQARLLVATAAACALSADREPAAKDDRIALVLAHARGKAWRVFVRGAFSILWLGQRGARQVLAAGDVARDCTRTAPPAGRCDVDVRVAEVQLVAGETLLAMPAPQRLVLVDQPAAPASLDEVRQLAERLRAGGEGLPGDAAVQPRSFFAIRRA